jgi:hypothetical protein
VALVRERTIPTERPPLVGEVVPTFEDRKERELLERQAAEKRIII